MDAEVMREVAEGDREAFVELYDRYVVRVHALVRRAVLDASQTEDVVRSVFVEAWRTARRHDPRTVPVADWLLTMAHLQAVARVRSDQGAPARQGRVSDRHVVELAHVRGCDYRETAAQLGTAPGMVRSALRDALLHLSRVRA